jgi:PAS domain S-box-containing protein
MMRACCLDSQPLRMTITALSASELRYRRLFEAARDGILIVDPETRKIVDVNPFLVQFLGYSHAEFVGRELFEFGLLKDAAASRAAFRELQSQGYIRYEDLPLETKDGRRVDVEFVSNLYEEGDGRVIQCNIRDITARKKIDHALREADLKLSRHAAGLEEVVNTRTAELRRSNQQLETFVYSIAHDLRAPLRTMQGFSQLLVQDHSAELSVESRDYADFINRAAQKMDRLLADLLAFSQISQQTIELEELALEPIVRSALADCEHMIRARQARVDVTGSWPVVRVHEATLRQVLVNLVGNAVKFVADKTPHVRLRVEEVGGGVARLWIEDNGIGIAPEFQERIFQVFQRLHTKEYEGTGIGLAIVQKGVERMGGRTGVISGAGKGSRFWIELPTVPGPDESNAKRAVL